MIEYSAGKVTDYADGDQVVACRESEVGVSKVDGEFYAFSA